MITKFTTYINESRKSIEELEMLNPEELGQLLIDEIYTRSPDTQFIQDILDVGCSIDARNSSGYTPLHVIASLGNLRMMKFLISKGADIHARNNYGRTPLHCAALYGERDILEFLLSLGVDINTRDDYGRTALHFAAMEEMVLIMKFLISKGADIHVRDIGGSTAWDLIEPVSVKRRVPELNPNK